MADYSGVTSTAADIAKRSVVQPTVPVTANRNLATQRVLPDDIPADVVEYFHGLSCHVRWGSTDGLQQAMDQSLGFTPVLHSDLNEDGQKLMESHFGGEPDGTFTRGDMLLQTCTFADRAYHRARQQDLKDSWESSEGQMERIEDGMGRKLHLSSHVPEAGASVVTALSDDTIKTAEMVREAIKERQREEAPAAKAPTAKPGPGGKK